MVEPVACELYQVQKRAGTQAEGNVGIVTARIQLDRYAELSRL